MVLKLLEEGEKVGGKLLEIGKAVKVALELREMRKMTGHLSQTPLKAEFILER